MSSPRDRVAKESTKGGEHNKTAFCVWPVIFLYYSRFSRTKLSSFSKLFLSFVSYSIFILLRCLLQCWTIYYLWTLSIILLVIDCNFLFSAIAYPFQVHCNFNYVLNILINILKNIFSLERFIFIISAWFCCIIYEHYLLWIGLSTTGRYS